jgi:putative transposase
MTRALRVVEAGGLYHVMSRGVDGRRIYRVDDDYKLFIRLLRVVELRLEWKPIAYCLMPNHYHVVVQTPEPNLPAGMKHLNGVYAQGFNQRYGRVGHLFQARYESRVIETEAHAEIAIAYVVGNAAKAGLCAAPADWPWVWSTYGVEL